MENEILTEGETLITIWSTFDFDYWMIERTHALFYARNILNNPNLKLGETVVINNRNYAMFAENVNPNDLIPGNQKDVMLLINGTVESPLSEFITANTAKDVTPITQKEIKELKKLKVWQHLCISVNEIARIK